MSTKKTKLTPSGAPVTKLFITTASVAAMLAGWITLSSKSSTNEADLTSQSLSVKLSLEPIPTIVTVPTSLQKEALTGDLTTIEQTNTPTLRSVTAPRPAPITVTRSSR